MLLPDKYSRTRRSLLWQARELHRLIPSSISVADAWTLTHSTIDPQISFLRFALMLDVLYALRMLELSDVWLVRKEPNASPAEGEQR